MNLEIQIYNGMNEYTGKHHFSKKKIYVVNDEKVTRINNNGMGCYTIWQGNRPKNIWHYFPQKYYLEEKGRLIEYFGNINWRKGQTFFALDSYESNRLYEFAKGKGILTLVQEWY